MSYTNTLMPSERLDAMALRSCLVSALWHIDRALNNEDTGQSLTHALTNIDESITFCKNLNIYPPHSGLDNISMHN